MLNQNSPHILCRYYDLLVPPISSHRRLAVQGTSNVDPRYNRYLCPNRCSHCGLVHTRSWDRRTRSWYVCNHTHCLYDCDSVQQHHCKPEVRTLIKQIERCKYSVTTLLVYSQNWVADVCLFDLLISKPINLISLLTTLCACNSFSKTVTSSVTVDTLMTWRWVKRDVRFFPRYLAGGVERLKLSTWTCVVGGGVDSINDGLVGDVYVNLLASSHFLCCVSGGFCDPF